MLKVRINKDLKQSVFNTQSIIWLIFIFSLILTLTVWTVTKNYYESRSNQLFKAYTEDIINNIQKRMLGYEHALRSGIGLLQASDQVNRQEWKLFIETLQTKNFYPGIQGIGFSIMLKPEEVGKLEQKMRIDDFKDFKLKPSGKRDMYSAILYLEPLDERNKEAIGYDMFSEPTRRAAMEEARDTGHASISGKVILVQEIDADVQAGILMYLPFYKSTDSLTTLQKRREALIGFVYSPFRMGDLMTPALGNDSSVNFEIFDNLDKSEENLLYRSFTPSSYTSLYTSNQTIKIGGRTWNHYFYSTQEFDKSVQSNIPLIIGITGFSLSFLLLIVLRALFNNREEIIAKNRQLTSSRQHLQTLLESSTDGIHILNAQGDLYEYSKSFIEMLGYDREEAIGLTLSDWDKHLTPERVQDLIDIRHNNETITIQTRHQRKDGSEFDTEITARPILLDGKRYLYASARDITQKLQEQELLLKNLRFAAMGETIGMIAHQWRQPLSTIAAIGSRMLLNLDLGKSEEKNIRADIEEILTFTQDLSHTITSFSNFLKNDSIHETFQIKDALDDALVVLPQDLRNNLSLNFSHSHELTISGPKQELQEVFIALLENAKSSFSLLKEKRTPSLFISVSLIQDHILIRLCDNGIGIDEATEPHIFEPYFTTKDAKNEAGLGLYLCKIIIEKHFQGTINVARQNEGVCFELRLPLLMDNT